MESKNAWPSPSAPTPAPTAPSPHAAIALPRPEWLALHSEPILEPKLPIVDPHHHLWVMPGAHYLQPELGADLRSGHKLQATVFVDCHSHYRSDGPEALRPVGETQFAVEQARLAAQRDPAVQVCAAIVGWADLTLASAQFDYVLQAHVAAGAGRFRGIRARPTWHADPSVHPVGTNRPEVLRDAQVQQGVRQLGSMGLSLDLWLYHTQLGDVAALAAACPDTLLVLDHCGGPLGVGPYAGRRSEVFTQWQQEITALAQFPNLRIKLGGLAMQRMGFGFEQAACPPDSAALAKAWAPYFETCIAAFGTQRCMFESNFPVDKIGCSYAVLWNAFKRISTGYSSAERSDLFSRTAAATYGIAL